MLATVATHAPLNSRSTVGNSTRKGISTTGFFSCTICFSATIVCWSIGTNSFSAFCAAFASSLSATTTSTFGDFNSFADRLFLREAQENNTVDNMTATITGYFIGYKTNAFKSEENVKLIACYPLGRHLRSLEIHRMNIKISIENQNIC